MPYRAKHLVEYAFLRGFVFFVCLLPLHGALAFGWLMALLAVVPSRKKLREAARRMREVFGADVPDKQIRRWVWISWRNLFFSYIETARAPKLNRNAVTRRIDTGEIEKLHALHRQFGGYILAVCHMGNWDLAGFSARILDLPLFVLVRGQSNPLVTKYLERLRDHFGFGWVDRHRALGSIIKKIRGGEIFTILPDVRAKTMDSAIKVPFLGGTAYLMAGTGLFARLTERPVVTAIVTREGWSRHRWEIQEPIFPNLDRDREEDIARITNEVMARFDESVRRYPEQYFWYNKRWVLDPSS